MSTLWQETVTPSQRLFASKKMTDLVKCSFSLHWLMTDWRVCVFFPCGNPSKGWYYKWRQHRVHCPSCRRLLGIPAAPYRVCGGDGPKSNVKLISSICSVHMRAQPNTEGCGILQTGEWACRHLQRLDNSPVHFGRLDICLRRRHKGYFGHLERSIVSPYLFIWNN